MLEFVVANICVCVCFCCCFFFSGKVFQQTVCTYGYKLRIYSSWHLSILLRSGIYTVSVLTGKEIASISVQFYVQVHRWLIVHKQPILWKLSGPQVTYWAWVKRHDREQHFCFLPRFTTVDREGRLSSHFHFMPNGRFRFLYHKLSVINSSITSSSTFGVLISKLIRYARACSSYKCFIPRTRRLSS